MNQINNCKQDRETRIFKITEESQYSLSFKPRVRPQQNSLFYFLYWNWSMIWFKKKTPIFKMGGKTCLIAHFLLQVISSQSGLQSRTKLRLKDGLSHNTYFGVKSWLGPAEQYLWSAFSWHKRGPTRAYKRPFRLHKQIKTPELISEQSQRNLRVEKREHNSLTKLATKLQLCMQLNIYNTL